MDKYERRTSDSLTLREFLTYLGIGVFLVFLLFLMQLRGLSGALQLGLEEEGLAEGPTVQVASLQRVSNDRLLHRDVVD